jgi:hypothetical protein
VYPNKASQREGIERAYPVVIAGYKGRIVFHGVGMRVKDNHADAAAWLSSKMPEHKGTVFRMVV